MSSRYRLQGLRDEELIAVLPKLVAQDNAHLAELLAHLAELDERRLYLDLGFHSMWDYCITGLGLCETTAWRRYTAARVCREFPEAFEKLANGELHLSVLSALAKHITPNNAAELFAACHRQSIRRVEVLLAERFPTPDKRDSVRRLPRREDVGTSGAGCGSVEADSKETVASAVRSGVASIEPPTATALPIAKPATESLHRNVQPLSRDRFSVHFTADAEFLRLLEEVRALASHREPDGDLHTMLKAGLVAYRRELLKKRFAVGRKARPATHTRTKSKGGAQNDSKGRPAIPAAVTREVYERDGGQCTYVSTDSRRCSARHLLEQDHISPRAAGGRDTPDNLRLRCRAHNQHYARQYFGRGYMRAVMSRVRTAGASTG